MKRVKQRIGTMIATLTVLLFPLISLAATQVCNVASATGDVRYRAAGTLNWVPLESRKELFVGDLIFTRPGASVRVEYLAVKAAVQLPPQTLFRIGERPPTYTKLRRRFGVENQSSGGESASSKSTNPFERVQVRNMWDESEKKQGKSNPNNLSIMREKSKLVLDFPKPNSTVLVSTFPAKLAIRVNPEFMGQKVWAFLWNSSDKILPIWSGYFRGELSNVPIPSAGTFELQVMSDDETVVSDTVSIVYKDSGTALPDVLKGLENKRDVNYTIMVE